MGCKDVREDGSHDEKKRQEMEKELAKMGKRDEENGRPEDG